jgi:putative DNA primase/helicase
MTTLGRPDDGLTGRELASVNHVSPLRAAMRYAEFGLPVFPVAPVDRSNGTCGCKDGDACESVGKHPLVRWAEKATTERAQITSWWGSWKPDANIGVPTGQRSGLVIVDIDRQHDGHRTRAMLEAGALSIWPRSKYLAPL